MSDTSQEQCLRQAELCRVRGETMMASFLENVAQYIAQLEKKVSDLETHIEDMEDYSDPFA